MSTQAIGTPAASVRASMVQLRLGREGRVGGQPYHLQPRPVLGPALGQVQGPVQQRVTPGSDVGQEDPTLPSVPQYCGATPAECVPFLGKPVSSIATTPSGSLRCSVT